MTVETAAPNPSATSPSGYDPSFLAVDLPLPGSATSAADLAELPYTHFSVILNRRRRLAELTAVNIDGAELVDVERGDDWHLDERVPADEQAGEDVYARNDLDRGHLVRRRDPVWGPDAALANADTFSYTNAAPQVNTFNQSKDLWLGLEDYVLGNAQTTDRRLSVFTGPILDAGDPEYRGVQIPRAFYKVAAWATDDALACTAYLLDQGELLDALTLPTATTDVELGAFRTFQVAVAEIASLTGLELGALVDADRFVRAGVRSGERRELREYGDIRL